MARYSLSNYILTITIPTSLANALGINTIQIGGEGSYLNSISISLNSNMFETETDYTGSWVHNKNLNLSGTCEIQLNQLSPNIERFKQLCNIYRSSELYDGLDMVLQDLSGNTIATITDSLITKIPEQTFANTAAMQSWSFTCGQIKFN